MGGAGSARQAGNRPVRYRRHRVFAGALDQRTIVAGMRLVPTSSPTLLSELFPSARLERPGPAPRCLRVVAYFRGGQPARRACGSARRGGDPGRRDGIWPVHRPLGVQIVLESWWLPRLLDQGWKARPLGLPIEINSLSTVAVIVDVNDEVWTEICARRSVPGQMLVWQGLSAVERHNVTDPVPAL